MIVRGGGQSVGGGLVLMDSSGGRAWRWISSLQIPHLQKKIRLVSESKTDDDEEQTPCQDDEIQSGG